MPTNINLPIVVVAYNRPASLMRLLTSLDKADYPAETRLIISIDKSDSNQVEELAQQFNWKHGEKEIIAQTTNMGLRNHILACGDLTMHYDAIIMLEDDLVVSPAFYDYTLQALDFYNHDKKISGISLYANAYNETAELPFMPLADDSDVFFMQLPSSWGQCWTKEQWSDFRKWYEMNQNLELTTQLGIPENVTKWPESSWKKYYIWYMIQTGKLFVYPRFSLSTNCGDPGEHFHIKLFFQQVPLLSSIRNFRFKALKDSYAVYDAYCEVFPLALNHFFPKFKKYKYTVDLYGMKSSHVIKSEYLLTSKKCTSHVFSFAKELKPMESNIIQNIPGSDFSFAKTNYCNINEISLQLSVDHFYYFFSLRESQVVPAAQFKEQIKLKDELLKQRHELINQKDELINRRNETIRLRDETILADKEALNQRNEALKQKDELLNKRYETIKLKDEILSQRNDTIKLKDELLSQRNETIKQKDELINQRNDTIKQKDQLMAQINELIIRKTEIVKQKEDLIIRKDNLLQQHNEMIAGQLKELQIKELLINQLNEQNSANDLRLQEQIEINGLLNIEIDSLRKQSQKIIVERDEIRLQSKKDNELLLANSNALREKSKNLLILEEKLKSRDELIRNIEKSYTFKVGKLIAYPIKKMLGR